MKAVRLHEWRELDLEVAQCGKCFNNTFYLDLTDDHATTATCAKCGAKHQYNRSGKWEVRRCEHVLYTTETDGDTTLC